jgi:hypothetical protein
MNKEKSLKERLETQGDELRKAIENPEHWKTWIGKQYLEIEEEDELEKDESDDKQ